MLIGSGTRILCVPGQSRGQEATMGPVAALYQADRNPHISAAQRQEGRGARERGREEREKEGKETGRDSLDLSCEDFNISPRGDRGREGRRKGEREEKSNGVRD